jgi:predicted neuraminidase
VKLESGNVVLAFNNSNKGRTPLTLARSRDDGETWERLKNLEDEPKAEFSYPAIIQDSQGRIHVTYTYKRKHIRHVIFDEKWFDT